ncbi:MAG: hypothetical protein ABJB85_12070 [Nitrososphaerota archaeon]
MSAAVLTSFTSPAVAQSNLMSNDAIKLKEFQSATQGYVKQVKKMAGGDISSILKLTDSYVVKIKSIFGRATPSNLGCNHNDCIVSSHTTRQINTADTKIKIRQFRMLTLQFQKDVNLAASPSSPQHLVEQLIDIYANSVKDLFNNNV